MRLVTFFLLPVWTLLMAVAAYAGSNDDEGYVIMQTSVGAVTIQLYPDKAPVTVGNFMRYVDEGAYEGAHFYRATRPGNDPAISVLQGGLWKPWQPGMVKNYRPPFPPITHETTETTGLSNIDGAISMGRFAPGTASSEFFINIGNNSSLDYGGDRIADGQGFAVFGRIIKGMEVIRSIHAMPTEKGEGYKGQILLEPIAITSVKHLAD